MPERPLPNDPSFEHLRKEAKRLKKAVATGDAVALALVREFHPRPAEAGKSFGLAAAQLATARSYGFASWAKLKQHLEAIAPHVWNPPAPPSEKTPLAESFVRLACLAYAAWHRTNPEKARRLLAEHPDLAHTDVYTAAAAGEVSSVRAAIDRDPALVNAKGGPYHWEPLLYAAYSRLDTLEVARLLLSKGADPNAGFLWGAAYPFTALTGAFGRGEDNMNQLPHPQCAALARLLLEAGADPNDSQALYNRHFEENDDHFVLLFEFGLGRDTRGPWQRRMGDRLLSPSLTLVQELCWAAIHGYSRRVDLLVDHGVDVNGLSPRTRRTPYEEALRAGHPAIAEQLLRRGAKKVELDPVETFALAAIAGRREEVHARLAQDPRLFEKLGRPGQAELLHRAVDAKSLAGVRLIAELGADVNAMIPDTGYDRAPLHNAAAWGPLEMVKLLLELGADPQLKDLAFHSAPIGWAAYAQQAQVLDYLMRFATVIDAVRCGGVERVQQLLERDPQLAQKTDEDGDPLVFYLYPELPRLEEMIRVLTSHGVRLLARNPAGQTLLDRALARGQSEFAELLRAHGAGAR